MSNRDLTSDLTSKEPLALIERALLPWPGVSEEPSQVAIDQAEDGET